MPIYDEYIGVYMADPKFSALTAHITHFTLNRCLSNQRTPNGDILIYEVPSIATSRYSIDLRADVNNRADKDFIAFPNVSIRKSNFIRTRALSERTQLLLDPTDYIEFLIQTTYLSGISLVEFLDQKEILGDLSLSFIIFSHCYNFEGFDHWKTLLLLLSDARRFIQENVEFVKLLFELVHIQIIDFFSEKFEDLFISADKKSNFLVKLLYYSQAPDSQKRKFEKLLSQDLQFEEAEDLGELNEI